MMKTRNYVTTRCPWRPLCALRFCVKIFKLFFKLRNIQPYPELPAARIALKAVPGAPAGVLFDSLDKGPIFAFTADGTAGKADRLPTAYTLESGS